MPPIALSSQHNEIRVSHREEDSMNNEPSLSGKTIVGLIIPPPDIRSLLFLFLLQFFYKLFL